MTLLGICKTLLHAAPTAPVSIVAATLTTTVTVIEAIQMLASALLFFECCGSAWISI